MAETWALILKIRLSYTQAQAQAQVQAQVPSPLLLASKALAFPLQALTLSSITNKLYRVLVLVLALAPLSSNSSSSNSSNHRALLSYPSAKALCLWATCRNPTTPLFTIVVNFLLHHTICTALLLAPVRAKIRHSTLRVTSSTAGATRRPKRNCTSCTRSTPAIRVVSQTLKPARLPPSSLTP